MKLGFIVFTLMLTSIAFGKNECSDELMNQKLDSIESMLKSIKEHINFQKRAYLIATGKLPETLKVGYKGYMVGPIGSFTEKLYSNTEIDDLMCENEENNSRIKTFLNSSNAVLLDTEVYIKEASSLITKAANSFANCELTVDEFQIKRLELSNLILGMYVTEQFIIKSKYGLGSLTVGIVELKKAQDLFQNILKDSNDFDEKAKELLNLANEHIVLPDAVTALDPIVEAVPGTN